jgi:hypothetical protein
MDRKFSHPGIFDRDKAAMTDSMTKAEWELMIKNHDELQRQLEQSMTERSQATREPVQRDYPMEERATPYNRPMVLQDGKASSYTERSTPADPTAAPIATGGSLMLNDRDRSGLNEWFQSSFQNQFKHRTSWFGCDWFPEFFGPMRDRINANFDKAFAAVRKNDEDVVKLRDELRKEIADVEIKLRSEHAAEIIKLKKEFAVKTSKLHKEMALQTGIMRGEVTTLPAIINRG